MYYLPIKYLLIFITITVIIVGCSNETKKSGSKINIVCTTGMIADAVKNIVGDSVTVEALMGPGVDPHLYKATQGDLQKLQSADIIVYNGLFLEGKMGEILQKLKTKKTVIAMAELLPEDQFINNTEFQGAYDPHIWFDVSLWNKAIKLLSQELAEYDTANSSTYLENYQIYSKKLDSLHQTVQNELDKIPAENRILITAHDAFAYFGRAYQMEVRGLQGISTLSEFGLRDVSNLVDFITEKKIPAIYTETSVSKKAINAVLEGCKSRDHQLTIGGSLYSDAMGPIDTIEGTYIGMVNANVNIIVSGLSQKPDTQNL